MQQTEPPIRLCECGCGQPTGVIPKNSICANLVKGERFRYVRGHSTRRTLDSYRVEERGYATPCWVWQLVTSGGYGRLKRDGRMQQAHRFFYEQRYGPLPPGHGVEAHHKCENKLCVNPDHIEIVSGVEHRRRHVSSATQAMVDEIRSRYVPYKVTQRMLADEFGLSMRQVSRIVSRQSWV